MSVKLVWRDIMLVVNRKRNRLYDVFETEVAFSGLYFFLEFPC